MANALYNHGRDQFARGGINWVGDDIRVILINTSLYTFDANHQFLSQVASGARLATVSLSGKNTNGAGIVTANNPTAPSVPAGSTLSALIIYKHTGVEGTSPLIAYIDTGTNLPVVTNGGDITVSWNASGIFRL